MGSRVGSSGFRLFVCGCSGSCCGSGRLCHASHAGACCDRVQNLSPAGIKICTPGHRESLFPLVSVVVVVVASPSCMWWDILSCMVKGEKWRRQWSCTPVVECKRTRHYVRHSRFWWTLHLVVNSLSVLFFFVFFGTLCNHCLATKFSDEIVHSSTRQLFI